MPEVLVNIAGVKGEEDWENLYDVNVVSINLKIILLNEKENCIKYFCY